MVGLHNCLILVCSCNATLTSVISKAHAKYTVHISPFLKVLITPYSCDMLLVWYVMPQEDILYAAEHKQVLAM